MISQGLLGKGGMSLIAGALLLTGVGCSEPLSTREKGALIGGGLGAGTGALIGSAVGNPGAGAAIGGAVGAVGGGLTGDQLQKQERVQSDQQYEINRQQAEIDRQQRELESIERRRYYDEY